MLQYWSIRYFLIIATCVCVLLLSTMYFVSTTAESKQIRSLSAMAADVAAMAEANGGTLIRSPSLQNTLEDKVTQYGLTGRPILFILDSSGSIRQQQPSDPPDGAIEFVARLPEIMTGSTHVLELKPTASDVSYMVAVHPIADGYVLYLEKEQHKLRELFYSSPRFILLSFFLLVGWAIVYTMTRRLVKPIREVAEAAQKVVAGSYDININKHYKEAELYELTHSFNEMARRMARLESLRSQLLTGITKELRTPVVSIHHMIQAVKNREVNEEEAQVYLEASLEESNRLHHMIENLLEFNRFITSDISIARVNCSLDTLIAEIIDRWRGTRHYHKLKVVQETAQDRDNWQLFTDPVRVEQVLVNLLDNARDAAPIGGTVKVLLRLEAESVRIQVQDSGRGIPPEEHDAVFEPFYRGSDNTTSERELGIGLPSGRLIARSLGGDLVLSDGTPGKTTFTLILPVDDQSAS